MIDHRASPGIPEELAISLGMDPKQAGEGKLLEAATLTCSHCKIPVLKNPLRTRERARCHDCDYHYICDFCEAERHLPNYTHTPYDKKVDTIRELGEKGIILGSNQDLLNHKLIF